MASLVLLHGAFLGGWCYRQVARRLRAAGHDVLTPTLTGCGERIHQLTREVSLETHVQDLLQVLEHEDLREAIVVGHSYGGTVMTAATPRANGRITGLVYLDAQAPIDGQTASGAMGAGTATALSDLTGGGANWLLDPLPLSAVGITDPALAAQVGPRRHPHPMRTLLEPVTAPEAAFRGVTRSYVACIQYQGLVDIFGLDPLAPFVARARTDGWRVTELAAPHDVMLTDPSRLAEVLAAHA
jgi:pimeloyl-ACP methyl ester carboxylesterase